MYRRRLPSHSIAHRSRPCPPEIGAGVVHATAGTTLLTVIVFVAVAEATFVGSLGVNVAVRVWGPAPSIAPGVGE